MNLLIVTNMFIVLQEVSVLKQLGMWKDNCLFTINPYYVKSKETYNNLLRDIRLILPNAEYADWRKLEVYNVDVAMSPSYLTQEMVLDLGRIVDKLILVEDGNYDYFMHDEEFLFDTTEKDLYLWKPESAACAWLYKGVHGIEVDNAMLDFMLVTLYSEAVKQLTKYSMCPILFTSPLESDFEMLDSAEQIVHYLEQNYDGTILIKRHPRDNADYHSAKLDFVEIERNVPGQFLDMYNKGIEIFTFPSTMCFMSANTSSMRILKLKTTNTAYNDFYNNEQVCRDLCIIDCG